MNQFEAQPAHADASEGLFPGFPTLDVGKLVKLILRRLWIAGAVFGVFILLALVYVLTAKQYYESNALINIASTQPDSGVFEGMKGGEKKSFQSLDSLKSVAAGLKSGSVILRVAEKLDLRNDPTFMKPLEERQYSDSELVEFFSRRLTSELVRGERNIYLRVLDTEPERAQLIAQTLIFEFREMLREQNAEVAEQTRKTLISKAEDQAKRVDEAEAAVQRFREKHSDIPLSEENSALKNKYNDLQVLANRARDEAIRLEAEHKQYLEVKDDPERILEIGTYSGTESIQKLLLVRDQKIAEFFKIKQQFTPRHPTYKAYDSDVKGLNAQVRAVALALGESIEKRYYSALERSKNAEQAVKTQGEINLKAEDVRRQFRALDRARDAALATYDRLLERINDTSVTQNVDETVVHTFSPPLVNPNPVKPKKALTVALAGFFGGGIGMLIILVMGLLDRTLTSKWQVETTLGISVLTEIPWAFGNQSWDLKQSILVSKDPNSMVTEGFRGLRTSLSAMTPRSVMFSSAEAGVGKSFCAANMAVLQAQLGYRTLLIDADFRNPQMAGVFTAPKFGNEGEEGLVTQNYCQETVVPNLFLISMGRFMPDGGEPLNGEHFAAMLWEAYSSFDCVIIDTSPLGMVSDGLNYSRYADAVVLVVKADSTQAGPALDVLKELRRMRAPIAGCVLNGIAKISPAKERYVKRSIPVAHEPPAGIAAPSSG